LVLPRLNLYRAWLLRFVLVSVICVGTISIDQIAIGDEIISSEQIELLSLCRGLNIVEGKCDCIIRMSNNIGDNDLVARELIAIKLDDVPAVSVLAREIEASNFYTKDKDRRLSEVESQRVFIMTGRSFVHSVKNICGLDIIGSK
jgi:hypothetical protein